jgi:hypothetical protein
MHGQRLAAMHAAMAVLERTQVGYAYAYAHAYAYAYAHAYA